VSIVVVRLDVAEVEPGSLGDAAGAWRVEGAARVGEGTVFVLDAPSSCGFVLLDWLRQLRRIRDTAQTSAVQPHRDPTPDRDIIHPLRTRDPAMASPRSPNRSHRTTGRVRAGR
jgi:hypothetical protein